MKLFIVLVACLGYVAARPEAGYSYQAPQGGGHHHGGGGHGGGGGGGGFIGGFGGGGGGGGSNDFIGSSSGGFGVGQSFGGGQGGGFGGGQGGGFGGGQGGGFGGGQGGGFIGGGGGQQAIVQKHIYVHVPPPDQEELRAQQLVQNGIRQKHYKIIFIKTPSVQPSAAQIALQQQLTEEKTIVYVLVKKPEEGGGDLSLPALAPSAPSKPEVYFIKYRTQKNGGGGGGIGVGGGAIGGGLNDAGSVNIGNLALNNGGSGHGHGQGHSHGSGSSIQGVQSQYGPPGQSGPY